ncbi:hypothetical protein [Pyrobaculum islandicum]|uniref:hypothetical protein n=1 Tax=Pyrobaculum islandicum TaxID=2277 RepID=UPI00069D3DA1|nr:hypothetical protein [Pyrobaculum islandicum]
MDVRPGDLLGRDPLVGKREVSGGSLIYAVARVGPTQAPTPPGVFIAIRFKAVAPGEAETRVEKASFADEKFNDAAVLAKNAKVVVTAQVTTPTTPAPTTPSKPQQETATTTAHYQIPPEAAALAALAAVSAAVVVLMARRKT